jgi:hypothetical protein
VHHPIFFGHLLSKYERTNEAFALILVIKSMQFNINIPVLGRGFITVPSPHYTPDINTVLIRG